MKTLYQIECQRTNVTPKQFFEYCKKQAEKQKANIEDWTTFEDWANEKQNSPYRTEKHLDWDKPRTEANKNMPYDMQMYLQGAYNFILEFEFDDEKRGHGYMFMMEIER